LRFSLLIGFGVRLKVDRKKNPNRTLKKRQNSIPLGIALHMAEADTHILVLASRIVTAHVGNNTVGTGAISALIRSVYNTLSDLSGDEPLPLGEAAPIPTSDLTEHAHYHVHPAMLHKHGSMKSGGHIHPEYGETVFPDHLICMEDGLSMKMLKRHLQTVHGMTPQQYRAKWRLPPDYPMVASDYARLRSSLALESGLGLKPEARPTRRDRRGRV
jgi:predicted transcriptional regulator